MNTLARLQTTLIADQVKDHLDDFRNQEMISSAQYSKATSFRRLLNAINSADMDICRLVKQEVQMVVLVPAGTEEILLESAPSFLNPTTDGDWLAEVEAATGDATIQANQVFLNREWFVDASQIRSQYIHTYSRFPTGNTTPAGKLKVVRAEMFDEAKMRGYYDDAAWGELSVAYFEAATKRLRLGTSFSSRKFLSFPAYLIPAKLDLVEVQSGAWDQYRIKSPTYAELALVYKTLEKAAPLGSPAQQYMMQMSARELQNLYTHIPQNTAAIEITDGYIG